MKRYQLKGIHIYLIELTVILCIFSVFQISLNCSEKEAVERGEQIHLWHEQTYVFKNKNNRNHHNVNESEKETSDVLTSTEKVKR